LVSVYRLLIKHFRFRLQKRTGTINQIDIASTISIALGLPIPQNNLGKPIYELLGGLSDAEFLEALEEMRNSLSQKAEGSVGTIYFGWCLLSYAS